MRLSTQTEDSLSSPPIQRLNPDSIARSYSKLAGELRGGQRLFIGICGPPAGGKSTFAKWLVDQVNSNGSRLAAVLGQDGYHRKNRDLEATGLRHRKGRPETFDPGFFLRDLSKVRDGHGQDITTPIYSREIHDTVDGNVIPASARLIVVEGIFLLLDTPPWNELRGIMHETLYLSRSWPDCRRTLLQRQIRGKAPDSGGGPTPIWRAITNHVKNVDYENFKLIDRSRSRATRVIQLTSWINAM
jgi:pantothenate kinase